MQRNGLITLAATAALAATLLTPWARGEKVGLAVVRLFRPFPSEALLAAIPPTATRLPGCMKAGRNMER